MIGGLTYVLIVDSSNELNYPTGDTIQVFADYNEAMSWAKFIDINAIGTNKGEIWVWNWNGGSGRWLNNVFTPETNTNYPTP